MKFFTKVQQLTLSQSAMDCLIDYKLQQLFSLFYYKSIQSRQTANHLSR